MRDLHSMGRAVVPVLQGEIKDGCAKQEQVRQGGAGEDMNREEVLHYILESKKAGKKKDEIFEDLVDNHGVSGLVARTSVESVRW